jgi:ATP/ADP translocase
MTESQDAMRQAMWAAAGVALVMVGQVVATRAVRDGFFLTHFEATALPSMMTAASLFSIVVVLGSTRLLRNVAPARSLPVFFGMSAIFFALEWALCVPFPRISAVLVYLHTMSLSALVASGFWSVVNERFDPHSAKRLIGRIAGGASLGGVIGGVGAWLGAAAVEIPTMILAMGALNLACVFGVLWIGEGEHGSHALGSNGGGAQSSVWDIFQETPYLRNIAAVVILSAFTQAVYDYVFKASAAAHYTSSAELVSFFALFYLGISLVTFVIQNGLARRSLERFGLAFTVASLPGTGLVTGALALLAPGLASGIGMRGGTGVVENSLFRSGYELLYTPVLPEKKRPTKTLIDVGGDKLGTAIGGGVAFFVLGIVPGIASGVLVCAGIAASVAGLVLIRRLHHGYVGSLADRLRVGNLDVDEFEVVNATMRIAMSDALQTLARGSAASGMAAESIGERVPGRTELIERMHPEALTAGQAPPAAVRERRPFVEPPPRALDESEIDALLVAIADLRSGDRGRIESALARSRPLARPLVGFVVPLLADDDVADAATAALRAVAPSISGALLDAVLQSRTPLAARRRLCDILSRLPTQRAVDGLVLLLADESFELRFRAAVALLEVRRIASRLSIPRDPLFEAALEEALSSHRAWRGVQAVGDRLSSAPGAASAQGRRVVQGVSFIFTLLLSVLDREPLQLAIQALSTGAGGDRGTGLEYLENVVPAQLLQALRPLLEDPVLALGRVQARDEILLELVADAERRPEDLASLRRHLDARRASRGPADS